MVSVPKRLKQLVSTQSLLASLPKFTCKSMKRPAALEYMRTKMLRCQDIPVMFSALQKPVQVACMSTLGAPQNLPRLNHGSSMQCEQYAVKRSRLIRCNHHALAQRLLLHLQQR